MVRIDHSVIHNKVKLDAKDKRILDALCEDSRVPISRLSKKIEVSRDSTNYKVNRLEKLGVVERFYPRIDFRKLGFNTYHIFLSLNNSENIFELLEALKNHNSTLFIFEYNDRWDLEWVLVAKNIVELDYEITELQAQFSNIIMERMEVLEINRYQSILFSFYSNTNLKELAKEELVKDKLNSSFDIIDLKILEKLCKNSRSSTYEIAKDMKINADTVGIRIKKLLKNGIIRKFSILPNLNNIGYNWYTFCLNMKTFDKKNEKKFRRFIENYPGIIRSAKTFGDYDILMYIMAKNAREFHSIILDIKTNFSEILKDYSSFVAYKEHCFIPLPKRILVDYNVK